MKAKWYFGALLVILSVLGLSQHNAIQPNQEIVLNFADKNITSNEAQSTITLVKNQLLALGAQSITVQELKSGTLHISYFSNTKTNKVKNLLLKHANLEIGYVPLVGKKTSETPNNSDKDFNFDVFEIQKNGNANSGFGGKSVLTFKQDLDRFYKPYVYKLLPYKSLVLYKPHKVTIKKVFRYLAIALNGNLVNIQEVRAGPVPF